MFKNCSSNSLLSYTIVSQFFLFILFDNILYILLVLLDYILLQLQYMSLYLLYVALNFCINNNSKINFIQQFRFSRYKNLITSYIFAFIYIVFKKFVQNNISISKYYFAISNYFFKFIFLQLVDKIKI